MHLLPLLLVPTIVASAVIGVDGRLSSGQKRTKPFNATFSRPISTDTAYHNIPFQVVWSEPTSESAFRENITLRATYVDATGESELSMLARDLEGRTEVKNNGTFWWMPTSDMTPGLWSLSLNFPGYVQEDTISENFNIEAAPISAKDVDSEVVEAEVGFSSLCRLAHELMDIDAGNDVDSNAEGRGLQHRKANVGARGWGRNSG